MIGVFDSGIGGLTVVAEIIKLNPYADIVYIGDTARVPWGSKKPETVRHYSRQLTRFLMAKRVSQIVVACHTASSVALDSVRQEAAGKSVIGMIGPSAQDALNSSRNRRIGVIATRTTINSQSWPEYLLKLNPAANVYSQDCPLFVPIVEESMEKHAVAQLLIRHYLTSIKKQNVDTLILACTHYPYLSRQIQQFFGPSVVLINPGKSVASYLEPSHGSGNIQLYFTDQPNHDNKFLLGLATKADVKINSVPLEEIENE